MTPRRRAMLATTAALGALALLPAPVWAGAEEELRALEERRRDAIARQDFGTLSAIYSPLFQGVAGNGQLINREQLFAVFARSDPTVTFRTDQISITLLGDTAVFYGRLVGYGEGGKALFASRFSHVFMRQSGQWVCVSGQSTPTPLPG